MKPTNSRARARFVAALIPVFGLACGAQNSEREEARALLARISRVDLNASFELRGEQIAALREMPLTVPALLPVRERCVQAHSGLLAAERQQADARVRIERAEAAGPDGGTARDPGELKAIAASLADAARALREAHQALPDCERQARELAVRRK
jgi:hypothetical protein